MSGHSKSYRLIYLALFFILVIPLKTKAKSDDQLASETLIDYFDLIRSGNFESALNMWEPSAITKANRLGIEYNNIPVKPDCNSPVFRNLKQIKNHLESGIRSKSILDTGIIRLHFSAETSSGVYNYQYFAKKLGKYFWLIFPQDYYAAGWPVYESKYFRFFVNSKKDNSYNKIAAASLDNFVEQIAGKIYLSSDRLAILAQEKIDYYLCQNDQEVARITGQHSGVYDNASDAIISAVFPEFHLVAQLLVNARFQKLPLHTLPFIEEGLAISFGGKWQRSPNVILDFGEYILDYQVTEIDSVLTADRSEDNQLSDITIPIEACLVNYIYSKLGADKFFQLYESLSGDLGFDNNLTIDQIKTTIADSFELPWSEFKKQFNKYISAGDSFSGQIYPGQIEGVQELLNDGGFVLSSSDRWIEISFSPKDNNNLEGNLMFDKEPSLIGKSSELFNEQYKDGKEYAGFRFGIKVDQNEIGLYDYATNQLKAKYVYNFAPDKNYIDNTSGKISAHFDTNLLDGINPGNSDYEIIK